MEQEEREAVEEQDEGAAEASEAAPEGGTDGGDSINRPQRRPRKFPPLRFQTYKEASRKYSLHHEDNNLVGGASSLSQDQRENLSKISSKYFRCFHTRVFST